jgi:hypothetical protein
VVGWREYLEIKRKRQRPWGLWRFILEELAVSNRRCVFRLPSGQPPICTGDQPFSLAFRLTSDLRRRSISGSAFQLNLRFSSTVRSFDLPSGQPPTCVGDQPSGLPSSQPSTCVSGQPSGPTFASTCDLRRLPILRPGLPTDLQLAPSINLPAHPPADFQLAPSFNLPVPPSNLTSDSHRPLNPFGAAFQLTCGLHRRSTFQPCLTDQRSDTGCRISGSASRSISDSRLRPAFPPGLRTQPPSHRLRHPVGAADRLTCGFRRRSTVRPCLTDQQPTPRRCISGAASGRSLTRVSDQPSAALRSTSNLRWRPTLRLNLPVNLQLALSINLPAAFRSKPWLSPRPIFRLSSDLIFGLRLQPIFRFRLRTQPPTNYVSSVEKNLRSAPPVHASANPNVSVDFF